MNKSVIRKLKIRSSVLRDKNIRKIFQEQIDGYELSCADRDYLFIRLVNINNNSIMEITIGEESVYLINQKKTSYEVTIIKTGPRIEKKICEKRKKGILFKAIAIDYGYTTYSDKEMYPTDLYQDEYFISKENLELNGEFKNSDIKRIFGNNFACIDNVLLEKIANFKSSFETHMKCSIPYDQLRKMSNTCYSTYTYADGKDISHLYDIVNGPDKLLRVFDLYNGIINRRNIGDIKSIHSGLLKSGAFGYRELCGVKEEEVKILSDKSVSDGKIKKTSELLSSVTSYPETLKSLDRESLLEAIRYEPPKLESTIGMSYEEFNKLDTLEQKRLIKQKADRKFVYPKDIYINSSYANINGKINNQVTDKTNAFQKIIRRVTKK